MSYRTKSFQYGVTLALLMLGCGWAGAMRGVGDGEPVKDGHWPDGAVDVANLKSRFRWSSGDGGDCEFLYRGDTAAFQTALAVLAKVRAPSLEVVVHDGPFSHWIAKDKDHDAGHIDWSYTLFDPETWHSIYNNPQAPFAFGDSKPVPPPRIHVYVGSPPTPGGIDWTQIKVPEGISVKDERGTRPKKAVAENGIFYGVIYNMASGKTISGAKIEAQQYDQKASQWRSIVSVSADAVGAYRIDKLEAGQYRFVASAKGFAGRSIYHQVIKPEESMRINGELSVEVTVKGLVTDEQDKPVKGVEIRLNDPLGIDGRRYDSSQELTATSDADGRFSLAGVPTGYARFDCRIEGLKQLQARTIHKLASWHAFNANRTEISLNGEARVDLRMAVPGSVHCKVTSANEIPLDLNEVNVTVAEAEGGYARGRWFPHFQTTAAIDKDGNANFSNLSPGRYFVTVGYWVDIPETQIITVNSGKTTEVQLKATMRPKPAKVQEVAPQPVRPPKPPTTDDKF